jgi:hypothetical protein
MLPTAVPQWPVAHIDFRAYHAPTGFRDDDADSTAWGDAPHGRTLTSAKFLAFFNASE